MRYTLPGGKSPPAPAHLQSLGAALEEALQRENDPLSQITNTIPDHVSR